MPEKILEEAAPSDLTIHEGDRVSKRVLDQPFVIRQVHLVKGNVDSPDLALLFPAQAWLRLEGGEWESCTGTRTVEEIALFQL